MNEVVIANTEDIPAWLNLAKEVEFLFGPMSENPDFIKALKKNIDRRTAFCIRQADAPPGAPLLGGLLFSPRPPLYKIGWLAVSQSCRRQGIGRRLIEHVTGHVKSPAEMVVTTFGADNPKGMPARYFYEHFGFQASEPAPDGQDGSSRQIFRRIIQ